MNEYLDGRAKPHIPLRDKVLVSTLPEAHGCASGEKSHNSHDDTELSEKRPNGKLGRAFARVSKGTRAVADKCYVTMRRGKTLPNKLLDAFELDGWEYTGSEKCGRQDNGKPLYTHYWVRPLHKGDSLERYVMNAMKLGCDGPFAGCGKEQAASGGGNADIVKVRARARQRERLHAVLRDVRLFDLFLAQGSDLPLIQAIRSLPMPQCPDDWPLTGQKWLSLCEFEPDYPRILAFVQQCLLECQECSDIKGMTSWLEAQESMLKWADSWAIPDTKPHAVSTRELELITPSGKTTPFAANR